MKSLGYVNSREIIYISVRNDPYWFQDLPHKDWIVFTISDFEDADLLDDAIGHCLDRQVNYVCCAGELGGLAFQLFNDAITIRSISEKLKTGSSPGKRDALMATSHKNFDEGFWYATTLVEGDFELDKVVCLDFTRRGVKLAVIDLVKKLNNNWLPDDTEFLNPEHDS